jgi:hypothetical protein
MRLQILIFKAIAGASYRLSLVAALLFLIIITRITLALSPPYPGCVPGAAGTSPPPLSSIGPCICPCQSDNPIRYTNGQALLDAEDIPSPDGGWFGWSRTCNSYLDGTFSGLNGNNWFPNEYPYILPLDSGNPNQTVIVMVHPNNATWFDLQSGGTTYLPRFHQSGMQFSLTHNVSANLFVYTENEKGRISTWQFWDFDTTVKPVGCFYIYTDPWGTQTTVTNYSYYNPSTIVRTTTANGITEVYQLTIDNEPPSDPADNENETNPEFGRVLWVKMQESVNGSSFQTIREVDYSYYTTDEISDGDGGSFGNEFDLKSIITKDGSGNTIDSSYYRMSYIPESFLQYVVNPRSYARLMNANPMVSDPNDITVAQMQKYADNYFQYTAFFAPVPGPIVMFYPASQEVAQGSGCSCTGSSGQGTFNYTQEINPSLIFTGGYNAWVYKTVETLPDSTTNTIN